MNPQPLPSMNWSRMFQEWSLTNVERELMVAENAVCIFNKFFIAD
jgi:hypothetical protein